MRTYTELCKFAYDNIYPLVERLDPEICSEMPYTVDAEWLHEKLQIKKPFKAWIRSLKKDGMVENSDYFTSWQTMAATLKPVKVYHITLSNVLTICKYQQTTIGDILYTFYLEYCVRINYDNLAYIISYCPDEYKNTEDYKRVKKMFDKITEILNTGGITNEYIRS